MLNLVESVTEMPNPTGPKTAQNRPQSRHEGNPEGKPVDQVKPAVTPAKPAATPAKPVETKTESATNKPVEEAFDWASLAPVTEEPEDSKFSRGLKFDVNKRIPESIRNDVEKAFEKDGKYVLKTCATPEQAVQFTVLAKQYGKYRSQGQITVRGGPTKLDPKVVRFNAKPLEKRAPKEDKAKTADK